MFDLDTFALYGSGSLILTRHGGVGIDGSVEPMGPANQVIPPTKMVNVKPTKMRKWLEWSA
jgi:hypothetical protein